MTSGASPLQGLERRVRLAALGERIPLKWLLVNPAALMAGTSLWQNKASLPRCQPQQGLLAEVLTQWKNPGVRAGSESHAHRKEPRLVEKEVSGAEEKALD